jgi:O-acetyl-ADP-ribose deacetylase (regulator of RNase III)
MQLLDAVVSSDDSMLSAGGGVSKVIRDLAGDAVQREVASKVPLQVGEIAVTGAGNLPVKYVIHAVTLDSEIRVRPTSRTIHQLIRAILSRCEALGISRLAIPALATGGAQLEPSIVAEVIARALKEHALNPTTLREVFLPIPHGPVRAAFAWALADPVLEAITQADSRPVLDGSADASRRAHVAREGMGSRVLPQAPAPPDDDAPSSSAVSLPSSLLRDLFSRLLRREAERESSQSTSPESRRPLPEPATHPDEVSLSNDSNRPVLNGRYVLLEELGRGGMAVVHLSWDLVLRRIVAIKALRPDIADTQSLKREAAAAFELTHDSIVRVYHFEPGNHQQRSYLVMEYVSWPSGEKWIADAGMSGLPVRPVVDVGAHVCRAVAYAHSRNLLHLDIKPSNLFVDPGGEQAKLGDFGLACVSNAQGSAMQARPVGTPAYMAPEQLELGAKVTSATDVYQLGATLWDLLTGRPPKRGRMDTAKFEPERRHVLSVVAGALVDDPKQRPSAAHLADLVIGAAS